MHHCTELKVSCLYARESKKRGKAPRDNKRRRVSSTSTPSATPDNALDRTLAVSTNQEEDQHRSDQGSEATPAQNQRTDAGINVLAHAQLASKAPAFSRTSYANTTFRDEMSAGIRDGVPGGMGDTSGKTRTESFAGYLSGDHEFLDGMGAWHARGMGPPHSLDAPSPANVSLYTASSHSPDWRLQQGAAYATRPPLGHSFVTSTLKYPVLAPLVPHLGPGIPISLANSLLEYYYQSSNIAALHPVSPHILGYMFRKNSILHPRTPRPCSPALLASMLWLAAQTSDAPAITKDSTSRGRTCKRLFGITMNLLKPMIHRGPDYRDPTAFHATTGELDMSEIELESISISQLGSAYAEQHGANKKGRYARDFDTIATYVHVGVVVSASEFKAASMRWWGTAATMARELKLNSELPRESANGMESMSPYANAADPSVPLSSRFEEECEERRRLWWLIYTVDRHLALCYNRPLLLRDSECGGLLQPLPEQLWQSGLDFDITTAQLRVRHRGPCFQCTDPSLFGFFTPLMTILGMVIDLHHARTHPLSQLGPHLSALWDTHASLIVQRLDDYGRSLQFLTSQIDAKRKTNNTDGSGIGRSPQCIPELNLSEAETQTYIAALYGRHTMHVLHVLLAGKWDPISLLDDDDLWTSTQAFLNATEHAVLAAEAMKEILMYDPDLSFMPFFFGIYLLKGSFLLLLFLEKLQDKAGDHVAAACETIIRAHEICVVTLQTEYQVSFHRVAVRTRSNQLINLGSATSAKSCDRP